MEVDRVSESESEQSSPSDVLESELNTDTEIGGISAFEPYKFEPLVSDEEEIRSNEGEENDEEESQQRLSSSDWCSCGHCEIMPTVQECVCCQEIDVVEHKCLEDGFDCILLHPGFEPVCLNLFVLETAYFQFRQQYGDTEEAGPGRNRYTAYRQFARWCWGYLGKKVRVVLPSCVVKKIRETFPTNVYTGFKEIKR